MELWGTRFTVLYLTFFFQRTKTVANTNDLLTFVVNCTRKKMSTNVQAQKKCAETSKNEKRCMLGFLIVETKIYTTSLTEFMIVRNVDV